MTSGGLVFLALGLLHAGLTMTDWSKPRSLSPLNDRLRVLMEQAPLRLHPDLRMWDAWMGFNFSHSLGLVVFGTIVVLLSISGDPASKVVAISSLAGAAIGLVYVLLALRFWFWVPALGTSLATALLVLAFIAHLQG